MPSHNIRAIREELLGQFATPSIIVLAFVSVSLADREVRGRGSAFLASAEISNGSQSGICMDLRVAIRTQHVLRLLRNLPS
jgi:hypothetical protein